MVSRWPNWGLRLWGFCSGTWWAFGQMGSGKGPMLAGWWERMVCACVCTRVCLGAFLPPVAVTQPFLPRFRPQPQPTSESYGGTSSPSRAWSSPLMTQPSSLLPKTAPLSSVSEHLDGGAAPVVFREGWSVRRESSGQTEARWGRLLVVSWLLRRCFLGASGSFWLGVGLWAP